MRSAGHEAGRDPRVPALRWTAIILLSWVALAAWRPGTTWHLAPVLAAAAAPWLIGQDVRAGDRTALPRLTVGAVGGFAAAASVAWVLSATGWLHGPTLLHLPDATVEGVVFAAAGSLVAVMPAIVRAVRGRAPPYAAWAGGQQPVASDDVVLVEGTAYSRDPCSRRRRSARRACAPSARGRAWPGTTRCRCRDVTGPASCGPTNIRSRWPGGSRGG